MTRFLNRGAFSAWLRSWRDQERELERPVVLGPFSVFIGYEPYAADDTTGKLYPLDTISPQPSPSRKAGVREVAA